MIGERVDPTRPRLDLSRPLRLSAVKRFIILPDILDWERKASWRAAMGIDLRSPSDRGCDLSSAQINLIF